MRDVSKKTPSLRTARARAVLKARPTTVALIKDGRLPKGDPVPVARVAAIQAAKQTSVIIPYCHPVAVEYAECTVECHRDTVEITTSVTAVHKTGVEMEALTAASVAALTIYDMAKMVDDTMEIVGIQLLEKRGGKSDLRPAGQRKVRAGVLVLSDSTSAGTRRDESGKKITQRLQEMGVEVPFYRILPDDEPEIVDALRECSDVQHLDLVLTTGGTGLGPRDRAPEATRAVIEREVPGIGEALRTYGQSRTSTAMLSRSLAGVRGRTLIVNLPGSLRGVEESLDALLPGILHSFPMLDGEGHEAGKK